MIFIKKNFLSHIPPIRSGGVDFTTQNHQEKTKKMEDNTKENLNNRCNDPTSCFPVARPKLFIFRC